MEVFNIRTSKVGNFHTYLFCYTFSNLLACIVIFFRQQIIDLSIGFSLERAFMVANAGDIGNC